MGKTRDRVLRRRYRFIIVMIASMTIMLLAIWVSPARTDNLPNNVKQKLETEQKLAMAMKAWEQILQISPKNTGLARIKLFRIIERFTEKYIRWFAGIGDEKEFHIHPREVQHAAGLLLKSAIDMADIPPDGNRDGTCSLPEYKLFIKSHLFHYKVVKSIAGIEE